jgi:pimeloyl-ACP methyl ester carboxylesterase
MGNLVFRIAISLFLNSCISSPNMSNDAKNSETISTEIQIENKRGLKPLTGILTRPKTFEPNLLILFQSGSGRGSLDDSSRPYNPVREFLEEASTIGIASLRYDKRGTGLNSDAGDHDQQTLNNYESDALDAFDSIASKGIVKADRIVSMGHSLGGLFAIKVAQQRPNAGLILSATPSGTALEFMTEQQFLLATFLNPTKPEKARASVNEYMLP